MHVVTLPNAAPHGFVGSDALGAWLESLGRWPGVAGGSAVTVVVAPVPDSLWQQLIDSRSVTTREHAPVDVRVLGELEVTGGDGVADGLRRRRVRTMLELLALLGPVRRERLADLMWPDLDPVAAGANLRVTLTRLRQALGSDGAAIEARADRVALSPAGVRLDLWEFEADIAAADTAHAAGDRSAEVEALERACARWRGEPFATLDGVLDVAADVERVRRAVTAAALRLAALHLEHRSFDRASAWAERVCAACPYDERAHRLVLAAQLGAGDRAAAARAADRVMAMLDELSVTPEPETLELIDRAGARPRRVA